MPSRTDEEWAMFVQGLFDYGLPNENDSVVLGDTELAKTARAVRVELLKEVKTAFKHIVILDEVGRTVPLSELIDERFKP